jgi:hypothetical protein
MLRTLIIAGVLFAVVGAGSLYWCKMEVRNVEADSARFAAKHAGQTQDFIRQVNEQVAKGERTRLDFNWLEGGKSREQQAQEQHERLLADIDRLAAGAEPLYPEILYGETWKDEVEAYKTQVYRREMIQIGAIGILISGGLLIGIGLLLVVVAAMRNIWAQGDVEAKDEAADKIKAEMKTAIEDLAGTIEAKQKQFLTDLTESKPSLQTPEGVAVKFDESLNKFGKGLQNRLEGLISRIESAYNAGSKRNDEMLTHMNSLLSQQCGALEKMTAEIETLAGSFMHELAKQGKSMSERINESFKEHGKDISKETQALRKLIARMEEMMSRKPSDNKEWLEKALAELRDTLVADLKEMKARDDRISDLVDKVDVLSSRSFGADVPDEIKSELSSFRDELVSDMTAVSSAGQEELRRLVEKVEGIVAVGPGEGVKSELEEALSAFRDGIMADLAAMPQAENHQLAQLTEKVDRIAAGESSANIKQQVDEAIDRLRSAIVADMTATAARQVEELKALTEQIEEMVTAKSVDTGPEIDKAVGELKRSIESEIAAVKDAIAGAQVPGESLERRLDEMMEAVRAGGATVTRAADDIVRRVEELAETQASSASEQVASIISAGDTAFGDESLSRLADETTSAKEIAVTTLSKAESIEKNVEDACKQIYAIREYAARQQDRMERLQDGYDWNIIGNFCLRIIRCVDNLDDRIAELAVEGRDAHHLQLLRDELLFSMESSGVERFEVEQGSDFRGQEHRLKAQSQRDVTDNPELIGKVAQVIRPGYQCYISEDITKTVRPAEVRVYGQTIADELEIGGSRK